MRLLVVSAAPPFSSLRWPFHSITTPQPPGPGLPEQAPSLQIETRVAAVKRSARIRSPT